VADKADAAADFWYSARNSQSWWSIALSICATSAGAWLLYTPAEAAYHAGWWGIIGYSVAMFLGPLVMSSLAVKFREQLPDSANITDWVKWRFGRPVQIYVTIVLVYYMFIYLVSQLKTMGDMTVKFYGMDPAWGIVPVALFTMLYTMIGGLPASIITDWIQATAILIFVVIICITLFTQVHFSDKDWTEVSKGKDAGWDAFAALCFSIFGAEVFNLAFWQRIYAARDEREVKKGFLAGAGLVSFVTFIFGLCGLLLKANDMRQNAECPPEGSPIVVPAFTFFEILDMPDTTQFTRTLVFILSVCTITSCADSFQTAITSVISREVVEYKLDPMKALVLGEILVVIVNIPAMFFAIHAAKDTDSMDGLAVKLTDLFGMADIFTITLVVPLFSGLWQFVTPNGCLAGMFMGIFYIILWGWVEFGTFVAGFSNLTMMCWGVDVKPQGYSPYACGPWYAWRSAMLFSTIPLVTFVITYGVSWMENMYTKVNMICDQLKENKLV
jgi:Na+/proline symporter